MHRIPIIILLSLTLIIGLGLYFYEAPKPNRGTSGTSGETQSYGEAMIGGPFELTSHTGQRVNQSILKGHYSLVYFGYSFCPDVCPFDLQKISLALDMLTEHNVNTERVQAFFITVDPARDTQAILAEYVPLFHPKLVGLTGTDAEIRSAADAYRVYYKLGSGEDYLVDHSSIIYLMGPDGDFIQHFSALATVEDIANALQAQLDQ